MRSALLFLARVVTVVFVLLAGPAAPLPALAQADLQVSVSNQTCGPCAAGQRVTIVNTVTNAGPSPDPSVQLQLATSALGTSPVDGSWTASQGTFQEEEGVQLFYTPNDMDHPVYWWHLDVGVMTPNQTVTMTYEVDLDTEPPPTFELLLNSPADLGGPITPVEPATCCREDVGGSVWVSLPPWTEWDVTADAEFVNDGTVYASYGCHPLIGFTPGRIALIDRGPLPPGVACQFGLKAFGAQEAGAVAVVIVNNKPDPVVEGLGAGDFGSEVTIPVVMIGQALGDTLRHRLIQGETVSFTAHAVPSVPPGEPWEVSTENAFMPSVWALDASNDPDCTENTSTACPCAGEGGTNCQYLTINVLPPTEPPAAAFTWLPAEPDVGEPVSFTNGTTGTPPITFAWSFGDGATSTEESPTHIFAADGTSTVTLTATNAVGGDAVSHDLTIGGVTLGETYYIAAAGFSPGAGGSQWVTAVELNNAGDTTMTYQLVWLPRDADNSNPIRSELFTLGPGRSAHYDNVLDGVFHLAEVLGALSVATDGAEAIVGSRTFNQAASGTFGQSIPGLHSSRLIQAGQRMRIVLMCENDRYRSNLGLLNGTGAPITIQVVLRDAEGSELGARTVDLAPWSNTQLNRVFQPFAPVDVGYADVWTETVGGAFAAYGSVVDRGTGDPTTVMPE